MIIHWHYRTPNEEELKLAFKGIESYARDAFAKELTSCLAGINPDIVLLSGDIGNRTFDGFKKVAKDRFINCGIAEANMDGVWQLWIGGNEWIKTYRLHNNTFYNYEMFRANKGKRCISRESPVIIVGTGSGLSYAELGPTHHSFEDMAITRSIPGINVLAPSDKRVGLPIIRCALESKLPSYMRIGKKGEPIIFQDDFDLGIGKANLLVDGNDYLILTVGPIVSEALEAAKILLNDGISVVVATIGSKTNR